MANKGDKIMKYTLSIYSLSNESYCDLDVYGTECAINTAIDIAKSLYGLAYVELYDNNGQLQYTSKEV